MPFYRILLYLYPASFRGQYQKEFEAVFSSRRRDASAIGRVLLWIETVIDVLLTAFQVHLEMLLQDVRYTWRNWRRSPGFAITAVLVAALGVGATTAAYTITDYVLLRPIPYPGADSLLQIWEDLSPGTYSEMEPSPANYRDWKVMSKSFTEMAASRPLSVGITGSGEPQQVEGASVTANLFPLLAAEPLLGRVFTPEDDRVGAAGTVVLSYGTWQTRYGGDKAILGRKLLFDGDPYVVIGVMKPHFNYPRQTAELWTAMRFANADFADRNDNYLTVIGRLKPGVSFEQAKAELGNISAELRRQYPKENEHVGVTVRPLNHQIAGRSRLMLIALLGAGLCVLLIACTNLANLLLSRGVSRRKEIAIRNALGAGRERLVRQMLTESILLSLSGGAMGIAMAGLIVPLLTKLIPDSIPFSGTPTIDARVLGFSFALAVVTGIVFGVLPAAQAASNAVSSALAEGSRNGVGGRRENVRRALVVAEISISFALLICCGLLVRALWQLQKTDPGFRPQNVLTMRTVLPMPRYENTARRTRFYETVLSSIRRLPGVQSAGYTSFLPIVVQGGIWPVSLPGEEVHVDRASHQASLRFVTPGFFKTLGVPLRMGRDVAESDTSHSLYVAVVSRSFATEYWPGQNPIGKHFAFGFADRTVVGVVGDVRVRGLERESEPQVYLAYKQVANASLVWYAPKDLAIRSTASADQLIPAVRHIIAEADNQIPVSDVQSLSTILAEDTAPRLLQAQVLGGFAVIAIFLAGIGIHGLLSFSVSQRAQEFGVRRAVGAQSRDILVMVLGESLILAAAGITLGALLAFWASHTLSALLTSISPNDVLTYTITIGLALCLALAGSFSPALRAVRVDPLEAIRTE